MNKAILIGNICKNPDVRTMQDGTTCATFDIAVQRNYKDSSGNYPADFLRCVAWRKNADFISKYIKKGYKVMVEGSIQTRNFKAQDGSTRYVTEINVDRVENLTPKAKPAEEDFKEVQDDQLPWGE